MKCSLPLAPCTDLLPLAVGGDLLGGDKDTEFEDGLQLGGKSLGFEVLELGLSLPEDWHIQAQAKHADRSRCEATTGAGSGGVETGECCLARHTGTRYPGAQLSLAASALPFYLIEKSLLTVSPSNSQ